MKTLSRRDGGWKRSELGYYVGDRNRYHVKRQILSINISKWQHLILNLLDASRISHFLDVFHPITYWLLSHSSESALTLQSAECIHTNNLYSNLHILFPVHCNSDSTHKISLKGFFYGLLKVFVSWFVQRKLDTSNTSLFTLWVMISSFMVSLSADDHFPSERESFFSVSHHLPTFLKVVWVFNRTWATVLWKAYCFGSKFIQKRIWNLHKSWPVSFTRLFAPWNNHRR